MPDLARLDRAVERIQVVTAGRERIGRSHDDAGDEGTIATDDAIGFDPRPLLERFRACGAGVVVIGQVAGILQGSEELTGDLDLLWSGSSEDAPAVATALEGAALTDDDGASVAVCSEVLASVPKVMFRMAAVAGDLCTPRLPWGGLDIAGILERAEPLLGSVRCITVADLSTMRLAAGRPKDLRRA